MDNVQTTDETKKLFDFESVKRSYFNSAQLADAQQLIGNITENGAAQGIAVRFNFDPAKPFADGYGVAIVPITKRTDERGNITTGVAIAAIPDLATVQAHPLGSQYIMDTVINSMINKLANAVRPRGESATVSASVPFTVEDFLTSNRAEGVLLAFRQLAPVYVKVLKKKGLKFMTEGILRQTLQNAAFAEQQFPRIGQDKWELILDNMINTATEEEIAVGILTEWRETRDSIVMQDDNIDLSDLSFDEDEVAEQPTAPVAQAEAANTAAPLVG